MVKIIENNNGCHSVIIFCEEAKKPWNINKINILILFAHQILIYNYGWKYDVKLKMIITKFKQGIKQYIL